MGIFDRLLGRPLDRDGFAQRVRTSLAATGMVAEGDLVFDPDAFTIRLPRLSGGSAVEGGPLNLETLYAEYLRSPREQRDGAFTAVVAMALEMRTEKLTSEEARAQLRVQLRPRALAEAYAPIRRVTADWLDLCVCLDRPTSLRYVGSGDLEKWGLDEGAATVLRLEGLDLADQYATQKDRLETELKARGEDIFVANVTVMRSPAGGIFTYAVWAQDVDTLLPQADLVAFVADINAKPLVFRFGRVRDVLGELMESGAEYGFPPLHRVRRYPTSDEIAALGEPSGP